LSRQQFGNLLIEFALLRGSLKLKTDVHNLTVVQPESSEDGQLEKLSPSFHERIYTVGEVAKILGIERKT